jgi:diadenylate cyclase
MILLFKIGFLEFNWIDLIDVLLVSILLFQLYQLLKGSIALRIFLGLLSLYLLYLIVRAANMQLLSTILGQFAGVGVLAAIVLFQQEIRKFLLLIGKSTSLNDNKLFDNLPWRKVTTGEFDISPVVEAARALGNSHTGALIVMAKTSELRFYAESGDALDAVLSKRLLLSIFNKTSPLHDGAVIIAGGRIKAARCILPVTENPDLPANYGLRHRAALGMSEATDSIILVVSEETGQLSVVVNGQIKHNLTPTEVKKEMSNYLFEDEDQKNEAVLEVAK